MRSRCGRDLLLQSTAVCVSTYGSLKPKLPPPRPSKRRSPVAAIRRAAIATASRFASAACEPSRGSPLRRWRGPAPCHRGFAAGRLSPVARPAPRPPPPPRRGPPVALRRRRAHCRHYRHYGPVWAPQALAVDAAPRCARRPARRAQRMQQMQLAGLAGAVAAAGTSSTALPDPRPAPSLK